ncbi:PIG-L deacetylase family protein [Mycolicibacterium sphagni]|uniref:PIG-L family deacetylase n=1 Tax=Mycolicibacterium sphagni TaxID=1786 RepID=A0A255DKP5_9MYCO|nr:PIG-L deacetylase family protein [Mycolicibacterium sphagni]MCV7178483.1 PIG-L family deacetylase [Mycolicibacterium sphagni]OYN79946.1 PIG-L family deacetylase [Mycolicibacterium sphagni]
MRELSTGAVSEIAVVGAHCDDIAIGMGGTLLSLCADNAGLRVHALVLSGGGTEREAEERAALDAFCRGASLNVTVLNLPDGRAPAHWEAVKMALHDFRQTCDPAIVFGPQRHDAHQDHRLLAELVPTEFRDHINLGYEILKWETDTPQPNVFVPLAFGVAEEKARLLCKYYQSQVMHDWFDEEAFLGLTRLRGVQCRSRHAEAFTAEKISLRLGGC